MPFSRVQTAKIMFCRISPSGMLNWANLRWVCSATPPKHPSPSRLPPRSSSSVKHEPAQASGLTGAACWRTFGNHVSAILPPHTTSLSCSQQLDTQRSLSAKQPLALGCDYDHRKQICPSQAAKHAFCIICLGLLIQTARQNVKVDLLDCNPRTFHILPLWGPHTFTFLYYLRFISPYPSIKRAEDHLPSFR